MTESGSPQARVGGRWHASSPLAGEDLAAYMSECRQYVLDQLREIIPTDARLGPVLYDIMLEYPLREAKALRPALCVAACRALGGQLEAVGKSAAVLELYHNAFLIHDDIEDVSEKRRDGPTLHRKHGVPVALNVGDAMLALALQPLLDNVRLIGLARAFEIMQLVARMARESAEGQAMELAWIRDGAWTQADVDYYRMVHKKTTWYTFTTPLLMGARAAGASESVAASLRLTAAALGSAFQIQDDILNLTASEQLYGKEIGGDLWEGKHTLILLHALRRATSSEREEAKRILRKRRPTQSTETELAGAATKTGQEVRFLRDLIQRCDSLAYAARAASARAAFARRRLLSLAASLPPSVHLDFMLGLVNYVTQRDR